MSYDPGMPRERDAVGSSALPGSQLACLGWGAKQGERQGPAIVSARALNKWM